MYLNFFLFLGHTNLNQMVEVVAKLQEQEEVVEGSNSSEQRIYSIEEYLQLEDGAAVRHEFDNGIITEMAGGTIPHNLVKGDIFTFINIFLKTSDLPHLALNSDTKVWLPEEQRFVYPDITISDGKPQYYINAESNPRRDIITNPLAVVEVLSDDTRSKDKGEKFERYCSVPTFREYILVEPEMTWVKTFHLQDPAQGLWKIQLFTELEDSIKIYSLDFELKLRDIYAVLAKLAE
jgi:Uma2 family endonuclease